MTAIALPDSLKSQLLGFEQRLRRTETLIAIAGALSGLLLSYVVLLLADRVWDTPRWLRLPWLIASMVFAAWFAHQWAVNWLWKRRGLPQLAKILQKEHRTLSDRLQGVLELTGSGNLPDNVSPALCRAAVRQVAEDAKKLDFNRAAPVARACWWARLGAGAAALALVPLAVSFFLPRLWERALRHASLNSLQRWATPWANVERFTFASLQALPRELVVPHGEPFALEPALTEDSAWRPAQASARIDRQPPLAEPVNAGKAAFQFPGQTSNGSLAIRLGDAAKEVAIRPLLRPQMKALTARMKFPKYLAQEDADMAVPSGTIAVLEGSSLAFTGQISRALRSAAMVLPTGEMPAEVKADSFLTGFAPAPAGQADATFQWQDVHGLSAAEPYPLKITTYKDAEPKVECMGLERESAILSNEVLRFKVVAGDDFGVKELRTTWTVRVNGSDKAAVGEGETAPVKGGSRKKDLSGDMEFCPRWLHIPEDTVVELVGEALDYFPKRAPSTSWKHVIHVLSKEKHAEKIQARMEQMYRQLDDRIRDEERQLEENRALTENKAQLATEKGAEEIGKVEQSEKENQRLTEELTKEMSQIMEDALRNKEIPEKTLAEMSKLMEKLDQEATEAMKAAAEKMSQAAAKPNAPSPEKNNVSQANAQPPPPEGNPPSPSSSPREEDMKEAMKQQEKALESMRQAAQEMSKSNENLMARNFYNRLRHAASAERDISESLKQLARKTLGLKPEELEPDSQKLLGFVSGKQGNAVKDVELIQNDLATYLQRVPNAKYDKVREEMELKKVVAALADLSSLVKDNLALKSAGQANAWSLQMDEWAKMLQDKAESGGGGGGGGQQDPELMELAIAMMRLAQSEDNLREQTQALESQKAANPIYAEDALKLAENQGDLQRQTTAISAATKFEEAKPILDKAAYLMQESAVRLRKSDSSTETAGVQSAIIEILAPPGKDSPPSANKSMAQMQQMMQQMAQQMQAANSPGGNASQQASNAPNTNEDGAKKGDKAGARQVDKASGSSSATEWPEEYRDVLQSYFQNVEQQ